MAEPSSPRTHAVVTRRLLYGIIIALFLAIFFAPSPSDDYQHTLSSYSRAPQGARGLYDLLDRLGYPVARWLQPMRTELDSTSIYILLSPPIDLTTTEVSRLLRAVRAGAALLVHPRRGSVLSDSLGLTEIVGVDSINVFHVLRRRDLIRDTAVVYRPDRSVRIFESTATKSGVEPVVVGYTLGRGRVIAYADGKVFHNETLRTGDGAVPAVRLIEWLHEGQPTRRLQFDEYHHGFGEHAALLRTTTGALINTPAGRVTLQVAVAILLLLTALAVRPVRPQARQRIERRSALEHVTALANAYAAVRGERRAARLLVRGLRRRVGGLRGQRDEIAFMHAIGERKPELRNDVDVVLRHLSDDAGSTGGNDITAAIYRIERGLRT